MQNLYNCSQLLVVISPDWNALTGSLYCYQRISPVHPWILIRSPIAVVLGQQGMAWGRGLHDLIGQNGLCKKEGDKRSPAGLFSLGPVFGDAFHQQYVKNMPFLLITDDLECVDDIHSLYYNQFVMRHSIENQDWKSSEKMKEIGPLYALGLTIQHNMDPIQAGMGSAIFMHIWRTEREGTDGCTAMGKNDLKEITLWLNAAQHPCLVQLPIEEYIGKKFQWELPGLPLA